MNLIKKLIPSNFKELLKVKLGVPNQNWSIENLKKNGFNPKNIIDIGAYEGKWTAQMSLIFPKANFLMIEAQSSKEPFLKDLTNTSDNKFAYNIQLLSAVDNQKLVFHEYETASSILEEHFDTGSNNITKVSKSLDSILEELKYGKPDFIKLDVQGYELEILKGGIKSLAIAEAVLMEVSFIDIYKNGPLLIDVVNFMDQFQFQVYDICSIMRRPLDSALFQTDLLFVRKDSALISNKKWA